MTQETQEILTNISDIQDEVKALVKKITDLDKRISERLVTLMAQQETIAKTMLNLLDTLEKVGQSVDMQQPQRQQPENKQPQG